MKYKKKELLKALDDGTLDFAWDDENLEIVDELGNVYERYMYWDIQQLVKQNIEEFVREDFVYKIIEDDL